MGKLPEFILLPYEFHPPRRLTRPYESDAFRQKAPPETGRVIVPHFGNELRA